MNKVSKIGQTTLYEIDFVKSFEHFFEQSIELFGIQFEIAWSRFNRILRPIL